MRWSFLHRSGPICRALPKILGAEIARVPLRPRCGRWSLDLEELFAACKANTSALLINSPNNPTGWMLEDAEQQLILDFCRERDLWLIADEVYSRIVYDRDYAPSFIDKVTEDDKYLIVNSFLQVLGDDRLAPGLADGVAVAD